MKTQYLGWGVALSVVAVLLSGCGKDTDKKAATQLAAKVDGEEISVHQVNFALSKIGRVEPEQARTAGKEVLDKLVEQQLLVGKAVETKLDRDPQVLQNMEAAKRQILAQAYLEKIMAGAQKSTPDEIKEFFGKHPELFGERKIYRLQEILLPQREKLLEKLSAELGKAKSLGEVIAWLKAENIPYSANTEVKPAEQLPLELAPRFHRMKDGEIAVIPEAGGVHVVQLLASQAAPLGEKEAAALIEQFLHNQKRLQLVQAEIKQLKDKAKIEYFGDFQPKGGTTDVPAASEKPEVQRPAAGFIEKGMAGLK